MKTIRQLAAVLLFLWVIIPILILAALFCDHDEQTEIGDALLYLTCAIGGTKPRENRRKPLSP